MKKILTIKNFLKNPLYKQFKLNFHSLKIIKQWRYESPVCSPESILNSNTFQKLVHGIERTNFLTFILGKTFLKFSLLLSSDWQKEIAQVDLRVWCCRFIFNNEVKPELLDDDPKSFYHPNQLSTRCVVGSFHSWLTVPLDVVVQTCRLNLAYVKFGKIHNKINATKNLYKRDLKWLWFVVHKLRNSH